MGGLFDKIQKGVAQLPIKPAYDLATGQLKPQDVQPIQQFPGQVDRMKAQMGNAFGPSVPPVATQIRR